jgi:hypothetical protein
VRLRLQGCREYWQSDSRKGGKKPHFMDLSAQEGKLRISPAVLSPLQLFKLLDTVAHNHRELIE